MSKFIKTPAQIEGIRTSCREMARIFAAVAQMVKPGVTTVQIEEETCRLIAEVGGKPAFKGYKTHKRAIPFPSALCISINEEIVHGPAYPSREFMEGDIVGIDVGMQLNGYFSDMARTLAVGNISPKAQKLLDVTSQALEIGTAQMLPGNTLNDIGAAIQKHVEGAGFGVVRELVGHGVGLGVHEDPQIPHYNIKESGLPNVRLEPGMVLALEPMVTEGDWRIDIGANGFSFITRDGKLAAHFENTILITKDGFEVLTKID
jgi:methionyl aminopeptidase